MILITYLLKWPRCFTHLLHLWKAEQMICFYKLCFFCCLQLERGGARLGDAVDFFFFISLAVFIFKDVCLIGHIEDHMVSCRVILSLVFIKQLRNITDTIFYQKAILIHKLSYIDLNCFALILISKAWYRAFARTFTQTLLAKIAQFDVFLYLLCVIKIKKSW